MSQRNLASSAKQHMRKQEEEDRAATSPAEQAAECYAKLKAKRQTCCGCLNDLYCPQCTPGA